MLIVNYTTLHSKNQPSKPWTSCINSQVLLLLPVLFLIVKFFSLKTTSKSNFPLPPGPQPWPIFGNIFHMGKMPLHVTLTQYAKLYGPLISLRLGSQIFVMGSSPAAAMEILKTHDRIFASRYVPHAVVGTRSDFNYANLPMGWCEYDNRWKYLRSLCQAELFSGTSLKGQACLREEKAMEMLKFIRSMEGKEVNIEDLLCAVVYNIMGKILISRDIVSLKDENLSGEINELARKIMMQGAAPNISDIFPVLAGLDLQSIRRRRNELMSRIVTIWKPIIRERKKGKGGEFRKQDFLDAMINNNFTDDQNNETLVEMFGAGADASAVVVAWAMAELIKNPDSMRKVREELSKRCYYTVVPEEHSAQLPYLQACVKETLRLHPPGPFLIPHLAVETCQVMNYTIPKGSLVSINIWSIGRDPAYWEDPLSFRPERFMNSKLDYLGNDFQYIPFSSGKRICPGMPMASKQIQLLLANLIYFFDWSLPRGKKLTDLDMTEKSQFLLQKNEPLCVIPKARN